MSAPTGLEISWLAATGRGHGKRGSQLGKLHEVKLALILLRICMIRVWETIRGTVAAKGAAL